VRGLASACDSQCTDAPPAGVRPWRGRGRAKPLRTVVEIAASASWLAALADIRTSIWPTPPSAPLVLEANTRTCAHTSAHDEGKCRVISVGRDRVIINLSALANYESKSREISVSRECVIINTSAQRGQDPHRAAEGADLHSCHQRGVEHLPGRFHPQYFLIRTGVTYVNLSQNGTAS
jgi:hypothetical protein